MSNLASDGDGYLSFGTQTHGQGTRPTPVNSKLRTTCDRCTALKVRCNKERPACERCESMGLHCAYSPFRWRGRPSTNSNSNNINVNTDDNTSAINPDNSNQPISSLTSSPGATTATEDAVTRPSTLASTNGDVFLDGHSLFNNTFNASALYLSSDASWGALNTLDATLGSSDNIALEPSDDSAPYAHNTRRSPLILREQPLLSDESGSYTCINLALHALCRLQRMVPSDSLNCRGDSSRAVGHLMDVDVILNDDLARETDTDGKSSRGISTDQAMKANRAAMQTMNQILSRNCGASCLTNPDLALLLCTIGARMLARYQDIFNCIRHYSPRRQQQQQHHHHHSLESSSELLYFKPVEFVDFKIDLATSRRMNFELLLYEVKSLAQFLDTLSNQGEKSISKRTANHCSSNDNANNNNDRNDAVATSRTPNVQEAFHQLLISSVSKVISEIKALCQTQD
ncbi:hypothetical protein S7711_00229 [Stachybotrys chartarum IBT 7711]|uniref:Zn(2)-C6 fungal-type domain-containing protein n=1 Tax=Stachybotrys chartarum (strain CBS 109288 / IBT 7711) TaxID=1280523 RepID=A0A084B3V1_STACB|nr:hypothetical protein S7711_00229 [Stachybotrys chartarum IBT 7711]KFA52132.1 hypothetical protein S40293_00625 [Stachybotrys chartarum IBT 40293]